MAPGSETFEDLGLSADTVEALSAEGVETPTALQAAAIPVIRRGNPFVAFAGPGAGVVVAFGAPLLERLLEDEAGESRLLVLCPDDESASASAASLARIASPQGVGVAALVPEWASPQDARVVFGTPDGTMAEVQHSALDLSGFTAVVVMGGDTATHHPETSALIELLPAGAQRVFMALPRNDATQGFAAQYVKKALTYPPAGSAVTLPTTGGRTLEYRIAPEPRGMALLTQVRRALEERAHRVAVHFRTDDQAADAGDLLELHGYATGSAGDEDARVWLVPPGTEGPTSFTGLHAISYQVPADREAMVARHEDPEWSTVLVSGRELPHLKQLAASAGYTLKPAEVEPAPDQAWTILEGRIRDGAQSGALAPYLMAAEKLSERYDPLEVAAAALSLAFEPEAQAVESNPESVGVPNPTRPVDAFVRLFLSIGTKDGVRPGDLLGAITGESGVEGSAIGKIEIRDSFSLIEVPGESADRVIRSLNGTTVRGRSVRADYDRQSARRKRSR